MRRPARQGDTVLCALPSDRYINRPGAVRPAVIVRIDSDGVYLQAALAPGDDARPDHQIGFYGVPGSESAKTPGSFWPK